VRRASEESNGGEAGRISIAAAGVAAAMALGGPAAAEAGGKTKKSFNQAGMDEDEDEDEDALEQGGGSGRRKRRRIGTMGGSIDAGTGTGPSTSSALANNPPPTAHAILNAAMRLKASVPALQLDISLAGSHRLESGDAAGRLSNRLGLHAALGALARGIEEQMRTVELQREQGAACHPHVQN